MRTAASACWSGPRWPPPWCRWCCAWCCLSGARRWQRASALRRPRCCRALSAPGHRGQGMVVAGGSDPRIDRRFDPPLAVIGNLRFTRGGVYADYLIDGLPLVLRPLRTHERFSRFYRNLARTLPSGWSLSGLLDSTDPNRLMRNIVGNFSHRRDWVEHCRRWEPTFNPAVADADAPVFLEERRRGWLSFPVDSGRAGRTG